MKEKFNKNHKAVLDALLLQEDHVKGGKMFGYPAYYAGKKLCICLYEEGVGVKVPEKIASALLERDKNTIPFQPKGKAKMKEWVQINLEDSEEYRTYADIFQQSIVFLLKQQGIKS
jgi:hypothetical protein